MLWCILYVNSVSGICRVGMPSRGNLVCRLKQTRYNSDIEYLLCVCLHGILRFYVNVAPHLKPWSAPARHACCRVHETKQVLCASSEWRGAVQWLLWGKALLKMPDYLSPSVILRLSSLKQIQAHTPALISSIHSLLISSTPNASTYSTDSRNGVQITE